MLIKYSMKLKWNGLKNKNNMKFDLLLEASEKGDLEAVQSLLQDKEVIKEIDEIEKQYNEGNHPERNHYGFEPVCKAAKGGNLLVLNCLLKIDFILKRTIEERRSVLDDAIVHGHMPIINRLLELPSVSEALSVTHLWKAAACGHLLIVNRILQNSDVYNSTHYNNNEALRRAAYAGKLSVVNRLLEIPLVSANVATSHDMVVNVIEWAPITELLDHSVLREAHDHPEVAFVILQAYQKNNIPIPDHLGVKGYNNCRLFFERYMQILETPKILTGHLINALTTIVLEYIDPLFSDYTSIRQVLPGFIPWFENKKLINDNPNPSVKTDNNHLSLKK